MKITNKTDYSMEIVWDQAAFVLDGESSGVVSGETRFMDVGRPQPPTIIPSHASVSVTAIPKSQIASTSVLDFFWPNKLAQTVNARLILPLKVQDVVNPYTFVFEMSPPPAAQSGK